jgi:DNA-binding response OmpR family regulator
MARNKPCILIADDEPRYVRAIQVNLEGSGYQTLTATDGEQAVALAASASPDLILLDVRMPGLDGYEACRRIREFSGVPIIFLTARAETADKVRGLGLGADDYVTKPFSAEELMARVQAVLRRVERTQATDAPSLLQAGELKIDLAQQRVFVCEEEVLLTPTEYRLLHELARHAGQVLVPELLLERVWGMGYEGEIQLVWQAIHRLRQKVESDPKHPRYIQTRPGIGYVFVMP